MATENYDPEFQGNYLQPGTDSPEADTFRRMVLSAIYDPNSLTLVKADWGEREVVCVVRIESEQVGHTDTEPVAILMTEDLYAEITPRSGYRPLQGETVEDALARRPAV